MNVVVGYMWYGSLRGGVGALFLCPCTTPMNRCTSPHASEFFARNCMAARSVATNGLAQAS